MPRSATTLSADYATQQKYFHKFHKGDGQWIKNLAVAVAVHKQLDQCSSITVSANWPNTNKLIGFHDDPT